MPLLNRELVLQYELLFRDLVKALDSLGIDADPEVISLRERVWEKWNQTRKIGQPTSGRKR